MSRIFITPPTDRERRAALLRAVDRARRGLDDAPLRRPTAPHFIGWGVSTPPDLNPRPLRERAKTG